MLAAGEHLGKAASFQRPGAPVPQGTADDTLTRPDKLVRATGARPRVVLGDLLHAVRRWTPGTVAALGHRRAAHASLALTLARGNHDRGAGDPPADWGVHCADEPWHVGP